MLVLDGGQLDVLDLSSKTLDFELFDALFEF